MVRCLDHRAIAGDVGHRGERVELLRARDARHAVHRKHRRLFRCQLFQKLGVLSGPDEAHERAALAQQSDFLSIGTAHLEHDVGAAPEIGRRVGDLGARGAISLVAEVRRLARSGLHNDLEAQLDQFLHDFRHGGDALFPRCCFFRYPYDLRHEFPFRISARRCPWEPAFPRKFCSRDYKLKGAGVPLTYINLATRYYRK